MRRLYSIALALFLIGPILAPVPAGSGVTNAGKSKAAQRLFDAAATTAVFNWAAMGTGSTAAAAGDLTLAAEAGSRMQDTTGDPATPTTTGQLSLSFTFAAGNATGTLCELGLFDASTSGTMIVRKVFTCVDKAADAALTATLTLTLG